jgi:NAD(P)-dependent dehydrogenase (short-subunit alcohol dehydrogenase family)
MAQYPLQGRTIFITGGASGIGAEVARQATQRGARAALVDVDIAGAEALAAQLPSAVAIEADVRDYDSIAAAVDRTVEAFGGIDVVHANAGIEVASTARSIPLDDLERIADINFTGILRTARATMPHLIDRRGYLLITASMAAVVHTPPLSHYVATKAGVEAFGDAVRIEVAHKGVDVGVAYFSYIDTPMVTRGRADPLFLEFNESGGRDPFGKVHPVSGAGAAIIRGIETRARRVVYPRYMRAFLMVRAGMPRVLDRAMKAQNIGVWVDRLEQRELDPGARRTPSRDYQEQLLS